MKRSIISALALGLLIGGACKKDEKPAEAPKGGEKKPDDPAGTAKPDDKAAATPSVGVEAGGIKHEASEGAAAVLANATGTVEVRRLGESEWTASKADTKLYPGDTVRTGETSSATIALADESTIELSEVSTVAIASREGSADPSSAAAVLAGLARFTVTPRAPGEGAFRVYTPAGVVLTRGTVYGVGVAASGEARVGVESGTVDVIGLAKLDAKPVAVETTKYVVIAPSGEVGATMAWPADDWGTWRDDVDAKVEVGPAIDAHGTAMVDLGTALDAAYADLQVNAENAATFEATAATSAEANDPAAYQAVQLDGEATIDASFALGGRLEALTWAYASHANLATDLYVRNPTTVEANWQVVAPRVDAAVLWPKRYEVTAGAYLVPLRTQYYVHHPRGRVHAELVGVAVPEFYANIEPVAIDPPKVRAKIKGPVWVAPDVRYHASARPVWIGAPDASWNAKVKVAVAPPRAKVAWYVRPPALKAKVMVGGPVKAQWKSKLSVQPPQPYAAVRATWKIPVGVKVKIGAPDLSAAANARMRVKLGADGRIVHDHRAKVGAKANVKVVVPDVKGAVGVKVKTAVPDVGVKVRDHRAGAVKAVGGVKAQAGGGVKAGAAVKVKVKPPEVKLKAQVKGGIKFGN